MSLCLQIQKNACVDHPGEMSSSAAPYDPIFWTLHGTSERFVGLMRVSKASGIVHFSEEWGALADTPSKLQVACQKFDTLPFTSLWEGQKEGHLYTNDEFYNLVSPMNPELPYVYDSLDYWEGCGTMVV